MTHKTTKTSHTIKAATLYANIIVIGVDNDHNAIFSYVLLAALALALLNKCKHQKGRRREKYITTIIASDHKSSMDRYISIAALHISIVKLSFKSHSIIFFGCTTKLYISLGSGWERELLNFGISAEWIWKSCTEPLIREERLLNRKSCTLLISIFNILNIFIELLNLAIFYLKKRLFWYWKIFSSFIYFYIL